VGGLGAGSEEVRSEYVAVRELDGPRPILVSRNGDWEYGPATGVLCHGLGQVIGQNIHALYFDPARADVVLRRGDHACPADPTAVSVVNLSARTRSALYEVRCPHAVERVKLSFDLRTSLDRVLGLYDAIEEEADDFYAYVVGVLKAVPGFPNDTWRAGFPPVPPVDDRA
jgi:hypothetical protein